MDIQPVLNNSENQQYQIQKLESNMRQVVNKNENIFSIETFKKGASRNVSYSVLFCNFVRK